MTLRRFALTATLLLLAAAVAAVPASSRTRAKPKQLLFVCASDKTGGLRYVPRKSSCKRGETVLDMSSAFFKACIKQHGHRHPTAARLPAGSTRLVTTFTLCAPATQPNEQSLTLPRAVKTWYCARTKDGRLRWVVRKPVCHRGEIVLFLPGRKPAPPTTTPGAPAENGTPTARDDTATTDEDTATRIPVIANDSDDDPLTVTAVDSSGTRGHVTNDSTGVNYDPAGQFDDLAPGDSATDALSYTVSDGHGHTASARVTVTVTGVDDSPVLSGITSTPLAYNAGHPATAPGAGIDVTDVDNAEMTSATVQITTGLDSGNDALRLPPTLGLGAAYDAATGTLHITGAASKNDYRDALRSVTFGSGPGAAPGDRTLAYTVDDGRTVSNYVTRTVALNHVPTDITLSNSSVDENLTDATVGTLGSADADPSDAHTYTLVSGSGDADNAKFAISGGTLKTAAPLDHESGSPYSIRVRTDDGRGGTFEKVLSISANDVNEAPTDVALTPGDVAENQPSGTKVGDLSATDPDAGATHTFALVSGAGDTDNAAFTVNGGELDTAATFDFEQQSSYSIRLKATDNGGLTTEKQLTVSVDDANDAPTGIALTPASIAENQPSGSTVGTLSSDDQDTADTHAYSLVSGTGDDDNSAFTISGGELKTNTALDFETKSSYSVRVKTDDGNGGTFEEPLTVTVTDANDAPTDIGLSNDSFQSHAADGTVVGELSDTDQDADTPTFSLVSGMGDDDNGSFEIVDGKLRVAADLARGSHSVRIKVDDGNGGSFEKALTIEALNSPPTDIALDSTHVDENKAAGSAVGTLSTTDADNDAGTYTLVSGTGDDNNSDFQISGSTLEVAHPLDHESTPTRTVRIKSDDGHGGTTEKAFTITVDDVNEAPTALEIDNLHVLENEPANTLVGTLSTTDPDVGQTFTYDLVSGTGDGDNSSFNIDGDKLQTSAPFDFETKKSYSIRVRTTDSGSPAQSRDRVLSVVVDNANDAPVAKPETFSGTSSAVPNTALVVVATSPTPDPPGGQKTVTGKILANDSDPDGQSLAVVPESGIDTTGGGKVDLSANGTFVYYPKPGTSCDQTSDSFDYTVTDNNSALPPGTPGTAVTTATIDLLQDLCPWYIDQGKTTDGDGSSSAPFNTLDDVNGPSDADSPGDILFVYDNANPYPTGLTLEDSELLIGEPSGLVVPDGGSGTGTTTIVPADGNNPIISNPGGDALALAQDNNIEDVDLGAVPSNHTALTGSDAGDLTIGGMAINSGAGTAVSIDTANFDASLTKASSDGASGDGIELDNTKGTFSVGGGALKNAGGDDVAIGGDDSADSVDFTYKGTISDTSGKVVSVSHQTGGTKQFTGTITSTGGGVDLGSNSSTTSTRFDGPLSLSTGAGGALKAVNAGTLAVTGNPSTLTTTTGTPLTVTGTTIDDTDLTFRSIASSGAANGVVLDGTGNANGSLKVTGNLGTCADAASCTGGAIVSSSGAGISLNNVPGGASFTDVYVGSGSDDGVRATSTADVKLDSSVVASSSGSGVETSGLTGDLLITGSTVKGSVGSNVSINHTTGSHGATLTDDTVSGAGGDGVTANARNASALALAITGSQFPHNNGEHVNAQTFNSATEAITIDDNDFDSSFSDATAGLKFQPQASSSMKVAITNNSIQHDKQGAIFMDDALSGNIDGTIKNNTIGTATVSGSGSAHSGEIAVRTSGTSQNRYLIENNQISNWSVGTGINILDEGSTGSSLDATVRGNTIGPVDSDADRWGIDAESGRTSSEVGSTCFDIGGATAAAKNTFNNASPARPDIHVQQAGATTAVLPGYAGAPTDGAAIANYLAARQNTPADAEAFVFSPGTGFTGAASGCSLPSLP